jgi:hypothetical protein
VQWLSRVCNIHLKMFESLRGFNNCWKIFVLIKKLQPRHAKRCYKKVIHHGIIVHKIVILLCNLNYNQNKISMKTMYPIYST